MAIDSADAFRKRTAWGDKPCEHPKLEREHCMGMQSGDYACTTCGEARWGSEWNKKAATKKPSRAKRSN